MTGRSSTRALRVIRDENRESRPRRRADNQGFRGLQMRRVRPDDHDQNRPRDRVDVVQALPLMDHAAPEDEEGDGLNAHRDPEGCPTTSRAGSARPCAAGCDQGVLREIGLPTPPDVRGSSTSSTSARACERSPPTPACATPYSVARSWQILIKRSIVAGAGGDSDVARRANTMARRLIVDHGPADRRSRTSRARRSEQAAARDRSTS